MSNALNIFIGIAVLALFGHGARLLNSSIKAMLPAHPPNEATSEKWSALVAADTGGRTLGEWERALLFVAIWSDTHLLVGAWLAFKVASKWQVWSNVVALPKELPGVDPLDYLIARRQWGARTLVTFLAGTAYSIVAATLAVAFARNWHAALETLFSWARSAA